jgi:hypothetical protein
MIKSSMVRDISHSLANWERLIAGRAFKKSMRGCMSYIFVVNVDTGIR